jgi:hypothetical protein
MHLLAFMCFMGVNLIRKSPNRKTLQICANSAKKVPFLLDPPFLFFLPIYSDLHLGFFLMLDPSQDELPVMISVHEMFEETGVLLVLASSLLPMKYTRM